MSKHYVEYLKLILNVNFEKLKNFLKPQDWKTKMRTKNKATQKTVTNMVDSNPTK